MPHSTTNRMRLALLPLLACIGASLMLSSPASTEPRIQVHCEVYATNYVDSIAFSSHLHHQVGNLSTSNSSTGESLFNNRSTSCDMSWFTTAAWFPVEQGESVRGVNIYYRAPGDQTEVKPIPKGLQLLGTVEEYNCGAGAQDPQPFQPSAVYGCTDNWAT